MLEVLKDLNAKRLNKKMVFQSINPLSASAALM